MQSDIKKANEKSRMYSHTFLVCINPHSKRHNTVWNRFLHGNVSVLVQFYSFFRICQELISRIKHGMAHFFFENEYFAYLILLH